MTLPPRTLALPALLALAAPPLLAHGFAAGKIAISHPWTRETAATQVVGGGFMKITNNGKTADRLVSATLMALAFHEQIEPLVKARAIVGLRPQVRQAMHDGEVGDAVGT